MNLPFLPPPKRHTIKSGTPEHGATEHRTLAEHWSNTGTDGTTEHWRNNGTFYLLIDLIHYFKSIIYT